MVFIGYGDILLNKPEFLCFKTMELIYKSLTENMFEDYYALRCEENNIAWTGYTHKPDKEQLRQWCVSQINNPSRDIYLVYTNAGVCVSYLYIDWAADGLSAEGGSGTACAWEGKGIGTDTLVFSMRKAREKGVRLFVSWVSENNIASYRRYEKLGFEKTDEYEMRNLPLLGGEKKFYKYIKVLE